MTEIPKVKKRVVRLKSFYVEKGAFSMTVKGLKALGALIEVLGADGGAVTVRSEAN